MRPGIGDKAPAFTANDQDGNPVKLSELKGKKVIQKEKLPFRLLADPEKKLHDLYGTWVEKSMYGRKYMGTARVTFVINEKGVIEEVIEKVDTKNHTAQILK